ncbi:unnamed protein product [Ranitomeya imitator]|uniref:Uncharacterized protein n=1 Tax=Ranitomeya imitator TaxID=111125 RepID=A0ABN9M229_9NEOB|nr:unnamed protein product [Ranitomeya imitator]
MGYIFVTHCNTAICSIKVMETPDIAVKPSPSLDERESPYLSKTCSITEELLLEDMLKAEGN